MTLLYWHALLYLLPAVLVATILARVSHRMYLFSFVVYTGTLIHEALHLMVGGLFGAKPRTINLFPRREGDGYVLGSVGFANVRWYNAVFAGLAPLLAIPGIFYVAWWRVRAGWTPAMIDPLIWLGLAPQILSCWPSSTDWRLAMRSWPLIGAAGAILWGWLTSWKWVI